ncbi:MarR family winged helix-turn-helix transcriptional regulator [Nonomuraea bangladeshensis]|uniref:MarR family winged helix-turn-helix transcriptional regulator n=1 Tax=Nonomuraea bangladeshensis TaxID=404385 RepID=UPI0031E3EC9E
MTKTPPRLAALTPYLLSKTGKAVRGQVASRLALHGVRMWHMAILDALAGSGPRSQRELAAALAIDPSDVTKVLDELVSAGHVERTRDPRDRRRIHVMLTPAGADALADLAAEVSAVEDEVLAPLDAAERAQLHTLLTRVFHHLEGAAVRNKKATSRSREVAF